MVSIRKVKRIILVLVIICCLQLTSKFKNLYFILNINCKLFKIILSDHCVNYDIMVHTQV